MSHSGIYGEPFYFSPPVKFKGLINQGATCYLNSVLQVLFMTDDFREAVERYPGEECFDLQLRNLFGKLRCETTDTFDITKNLDITRVYEQQDAAEYFEKILNLTSAESSQIFFGKQVYRIVCSECETPTETGGKFLHLPLPLADSYSENSVVDGIKKYFSSSTFRGENQMYCEQCDAKCDATFECVIEQHPEVLLLLLKRFELDYLSMTYRKNNATVHIPYTLQIPENQTYELYAVVDHVGDLTHGHYTACIKSQEDDKWFKFDDARVTELGYQPFQSDNFESSNSAYLLFYRKKSEDIIREVSAPGGCSFSTSDVENQCQEADAVNGGEHQDKGDVDEVGKSIKVEAKGKQEGGEDTKPYRVERRMKGGVRLLTKWDLVNSTMHDEAKDDEMLKQGSSSRYESHEQQRVEKNVQRAEEQKRRDEKHLQKERRALMTKPEGDTDVRSSHDQDSGRYSVQKAEEKGDSEPVVSPESTVEENQSSNKSGTCIVRIYEDEKRITPSATVRSTEKIDIKLTTLKETLNRGGGFSVGGEAFQSSSFQVGQNKTVNLDVRNLLADLSQKMFDERCQSPLPQNPIIHETRV